MTEYLILLFTSLYLCPYVDTADIISAGLIHSGGTYAWN